jgi:enoyl-CoA hydratase/carnithine racemase
MSPGITDIDITRNGAVLVARFNRPEKLNAIRRQTLDEIVELLTWTATDDTVRAIVFTGTGRAFSAGQDLDELATQLGQDVTPAQRRDTLNTFQSITTLLLNHPKVLIAALNGVAVGFGAELALACDLRMAAPEARIGFVEVTRALFETNGVTFLLPRLIGHGRAMALMLTGELISAEEAERIGMINRVCTSLHDEALAYAHSIAANAPLSIEWIKRAMRVTWDSDVNSMMALEIDGMLVSLASSDLAEGIEAFSQGRPARYEGR